MKTLLAILFSASIALGQTVISGVWSGVATAPASGPYAWSGILDPSRAIDWTSGVGFAIPAYSTACSSQPSLVTGSGNAAANTTSINASIASCDATHNVVNVASGNYYLNAINWARKSNAVVRGAGPNSTYLYINAHTGTCYYGIATPICMAGYNTDTSSSDFRPGGTYECSLTGTNGVVGTYTKGATSLILNSCGSAPIQGAIMVLDEADDGADTGGIFTCSTYNAVVNCTQKGQVSQNYDGRVISGVQYSEQQVTVISTVSGSGAGPYTVTIPAPGLYFNNFRSGQTPGAWWAPTQVALDGIENLTLDYSGDATDQDGITMAWCVDCWVKGVRSYMTANGGTMRNHVYPTFAYQPVIRDSYLFGEQQTGAESYGIQPTEVSGCLVENNIIQKTVGPNVNDAITGCVFAYNYSPGISSQTYLQGMTASHNSGSEMNLFESNVTTDFMADDTWGTSNLVTLFRNQGTGWQTGYTQQTFGVNINAGDRAINVIGNVLGTPGYHSQYEAYATTTSVGVHRVLNGGSTVAGAGTINQSIFELGWSDTGGLGVCTTPPVCDPLTWSTMMRWGNYDTVDAAVEWNSTEASPGAVAYVGANSVPATHSMPTSFYLNSRPSWFRSVAFPAIGPDITSGTTGICTSGTYNGLPVTASGQCSGGSYSASAWGGYVNAIPAQDCYLNVMSGVPDGSGSLLSFDSSTCY